jgi:hypothetical protein
MNNILWVPVDIPKFPLPSLDLPTHTSWSYWDFAKLTKQKSSPYLETEFEENVSVVLKKWFDYFPYKTIRNIKFNIQKNVVSDHIDFTKPHLDLNLHQNNANNEPCGYRILLRGTRKGKMYVIRDGERVYTEMPDDTDVYVLGHTNTMHGVDYEPGRVTIFTHFEVDPVEHKKLIDRSLDKYKKYAIMK